MTSEYWALANRKVYAQSSWLGQDCWRRRTPLFGTAPLPLDAWLFILPFALAMLLLEEGRKGIVRRAFSPGGEKKPRDRPGV